MSAGGLIDGLMLIVDDETGTYWHHLNGDAVYGPDPTASLPTWSLDTLTAGEALRRWPDLEVSLSRPGLVGRAFGWMVGDPYAAPIALLRPMLTSDDGRLPGRTSGLGVMTSRPTFYPLDALLERRVVDRVGGRTLIVEIPPGARLPVARWADGGRPVQIACRFYGFANAYPDGRVYGQPAPPQVLARR